jgi:eukaryotic-like serine/threonine-protein kinase
MTHECEPRMAIDSVSTLLAVFRRVQLLAADQVNQIAQELAPHYKDPNALADYLVEIDWLTAYQKECIFDGHWNDLVIGPYIILSQLGEGGVSEVFKAWDTTRGREVALKVLRRNLTEHEEALRQFQRELETVPRLNHPNVIKTFDADRFGNVHYFAMEFVEGVDLAKHIAQQGPAPIDQACDYIRQVAQGLQHAHLLNLVHRDIKPANLFLINAPQPADSKPGMARRTADPIVKILDWGLARVAATPGDDPLVAAELEREKGALIGTADYIAPEQAHDASIVDIRGDIYSLGCTFYFLLTGQPPYTGMSLMQKLLQHREAPIPHVREVRPEVPEEVDEMIVKMMAKESEDRYQIPLLVVAPLRKYCIGAAGAVTCPIRKALGGNNSLVRPGSALNLSRPGSGVNLNKPASSPTLPKE